mmetsp:Transcript_71208/g.190108  ORF Transcript_71208/g.190108 Transcript_71208/m.190108 type:complete len:249 (-) Transcript_71208:258-1004(-)
MLWALFLWSVIKFCCMGRLQCLPIFLIVNQPLGFLEECKQHLLEFNLPFRGKTASRVFQCLLLSFDQRILAVDVPDLPFVLANSQVLNDHDPLAGVVGLQHIELVVVPRLPDDARREVVLGTDQHQLLGHLEGARDGGEGYLKEPRQPPVLAPAVVGAEPTEVAPQRVVPLSLRSRRSKTTAMKPFATKIADQDEIDFFLIAPAFCAQTMSFCPVLDHLFARSVQFDRVLVYSVMFFVVNNGIEDHNE